MVYWYDKFLICFDKIVSIYKVKLSHFSRGQLEDSFFKSYYCEV